MIRAELAQALIEAQNLRNELAMGGVEADALRREREEYRAAHGRGDGPRVESRGR